MIKTNKYINCFTAFFTTIKLKYIFSINQNNYIMFVKSYHQQSNYNKFYLYKKSKYLNIITGKKRSFEEAMGIL